LESCNTCKFFFRRYFINQRALEDHFTTKVHKRRLKALELEPYSIEDSEKAAGKGNFTLPQKRKIETIKAKDEINKETILMKDDE
jgi:bud site selection protein 20